MPGARRAVSRGRSSGLDPWLTALVDAVTVQVAEPQDAFGIGALQLRWDIERGGTPDGAFIRRYADAWLDARGTRPAWIAKTADGNPVGFVVAVHMVKLPSLLRPQNGWLHVSAVYVDAGQRRRGIGEELLRTVLAWARVQHIQRIQLNADDAARALYERVGFTHPSERLMELALTPRPQLRLF